MLDYKLEGDILEVTSTQHSFMDTKVNYWRYDIKNWVESGRGIKCPILDPCNIKMSQSSIDWVEKHYLPKVKKSLNS